MAFEDMTAQMRGKSGFIAALDQSGGSTPSALKLYGVQDGAYGSEADMFALMHEMRVRIMSAPPFTGDKVIGAILFERTMDGEVRGRPVPAFLWQTRGVVPFLKIDKGLESERDGVSLMKPIAGLDGLLERAAALGVYGTKERSVINRGIRPGIATLVEQQFELAAQVRAHGLMPIIEPEVLISCPDKRTAEAILMTELIYQLDGLPAGQQVMLKLTIPDVPDFYRPLTTHKAVVRVVALSGGYGRDEACRRLADNHGMIASFSRALSEGLQHGMSDTEFNDVLAHSIGAIYRASTVKRSVDDGAGTGSA